MKVIFLDIDGVMNSVADGFSFTIETDLHFNILKSIVDQTGAKIVLSSTWRLCDRDYQLVDKRLREFGMSLMGRTPSLSGKKRGDEIRAWLHEHTEVKNFVILDDEGDMREFKYTNLVRTDPMIGLRSPWAREAVRILNGQLGSYEADRYNTYCK